MRLFLVVLLPFAGALAVLLPASPGGQAAVAGLAVAAALGVLATHIPSVLAGAVPDASWPWVPRLGLDLSLRLDGLALLFALLILGIGFLIVVYARYYLGTREPLGRFYASLLAFAGAMTGLVLAGNLVLLVVFWELTSLTSFLLIGYWSHQPAARHGARTALIVTGTGGLALLAAALLLGQIVGSFDLAAVLGARERVQGHPLYHPMLVLVLIAAFTKSAQIPFHFWLPQAMAAPTPVSAYLHSAAMVKAGVFLLARLHPVLAGTEAWFTLVTVTGLVTLLLGAYAALWQQDLKGLLAYSTISHLGLIVLLLGFATPTASIAAVFHIVNHATFKASLFMAAGIIDHETGTRDMRVLNGLWRWMPYTGALAVLGAGAMAGVPLLNGFLSKEMFFGEALAVEHPGSWSWIFSAGALVAGIFSVTYSIRFIHEVFFSGAGTGMPKTPHEPPRWMRVPVEILAAFCLLVGILPGVLIQPLLSVAAEPVVGGPLPDYNLSLWHGWNLQLAMSGVALTGGALLYRLLRPTLDDPRRSASLRAPGTPLYVAAIRAAVREAHTFTARIENGSLQRSVAVLVGAALVVALVPLWQFGLDWGGGERGLDADGGSLVVWLILVVAAVTATAYHHQRLTALVLLSAVGLVVALAFVRLSAPDLALTQLLVEMVSILLLLLALRHLPLQSAPSSSRGRVYRDLGLSLGAGVGGAALVWAILGRPVEGISTFFAEQSKPAGGGANIVNVILVDFRGFDTLGEIAVIAIAALGVAMLLAGVRPVAPDPRYPLARDRHPVILAMISRPLLSLALLIAIYLFLRGHNLPGGGFIAGLTTAVALILQYLANGIAWTERRFRGDLRPAVALGLAVALATGLGSWIFGAPFLTSAYDHFHLPLVGEFELATALLFDLGVYLTVVAAVLLILGRLGRLSRKPEPDPTFEREADPWVP